jgi:prepilin-type N-terminal cleavage/methylation domain-containing protein
MSADVTLLHAPSRSGTAQSKSRRVRRASRSSDSGFTLIELLIVVTIIPIIVGALAAGLISVFSLQAGVSNRLGDSADAQVVAASFNKDVQSATSLSTNTTPLCGPAAETQMLGLIFGANSEYVSYDEQPQSDGTFTLVRNECDEGSSTQPTSSTVLSYDLLQPCIAPMVPPSCQPAPVAYDGTVAQTTSDAPLSTIGITAVKFPITEPKSSYVYALSATPSEGSSTLLSNEGAPTQGASCGKALANTGTYASSICFIGFDTTRDIEAAYPVAGNTCTETDPGQQGKDMSVDLPDGDTMSFCLTVIPGAGENQSSNPPPVVAVPTPVGGGSCGTQCDFDKSNGEGFLGNDDVVEGVATPFYAGIGCPGSPSPVSASNVVLSSCIDPAIFQTVDGGNDTVTLSNIVVTTPVGVVASNYQVVTVDAETIDPNGSITWTSKLPASSPATFSLLPNFSGSDLGNACNDVPPGDTGAAGWGIQDGDSADLSNGVTYPGDLVGLGHATVTCTSNWQTQGSLVRTGTAMLALAPATVNGSAQPVTISAQLKGEGYNAVAFGIYLSS